MLRFYKPPEILSGRQTDLERRPSVAEKAEATAAAISAPRPSSSAKLFQAPLPEKSADRRDGQFSSKNRKKKKKKRETSWKFSLSNFHDIVVLHPHRYGRFYGIC